MLQESLNFTNYNDKFDKEIESKNKEALKKEINILKNSLQKKEYEITSITTLYQEIKKLNEQIRQECEALNEKNIILIKEKTSIEEKYENRIEIIETEYKKKINEYEIKISNFSSFNEENLKNKIENDYKERYEEKLYLKDKEISEKNQIIEQIKNEYELLEKNYKFEKESIIKDMNTFKNLHKTEINDLLQRIQLLKEKNENNGILGDDSRILNLNNELIKAKRQANILTSENFKLKVEIESSVKEKNELRTKNMILFDKFKFEEKKNEFELKRLNNNIENLKLENNSLKYENQQNKNKIKEFYIEKKDLKNEISSKNMEYQQLQNEANILRELLKTHQDDFDKNINENDKIKNEIILKGRMNEEKYKKEIEELNTKLKENTNIEAFEEMINNKEEEIIRLKKKIKELEGDVVVDSNLIKKYNEVVKKKNYYKNQCKLLNEKMQKMVDKLNPEQIQEFKKLFNFDNFEISQSAVI